MIALVAVVGFRAFPNREVTILSDEGRIRVAATFDPRDEGLDAANIHLNPGDEVLFSNAGDQSSLAIRRARTVQITVDGKVITVRTQAATVEGALAQAGVSLGANDRLVLDGHRTTPRASLDSTLYASATAPVPPRDGALHARSATLEIVRARPVIIIASDRVIQASSAAGTVREVLDELGMTVREGDLVRPGLDSPVSANMAITLARAKVVTVVLDGRESSLYTQANDVAGILSVLGITPGPDDLISLPLTAAVESGMRLEIGLTRVVEEEVQVPIQPVVVYERDPNLAAGQIRVEPGVPGLRTERYRVRYRNGVEESRTLIDGGITIVREAVPERHITGTKAAPPSARPATTISAPDCANCTYTKKVTVRATWYNASHGGRDASDPWYGVTATGIKVDWGICAVDPNYIPLYTWMYIPGYGKCQARDTGSGVKGWHVDLGFPESVGNPGWGARDVEILILD